MDTRGNKALLGVTGNRRLLGVPGNRALLGVTGDRGLLGVAERVTRGIREQNVTRKQSGTMGYKGTEGY